MDALSLLPEYQDLPIESRSRLVIIAAQRARQFMQGTRPSIATKHTKPTTMALEEVLKGKVQFLVGKEARQAMKEASKKRARELDRPNLANVGRADAQEH